MGQPQTTGDAATAPSSKPGNSTLKVVKGTLTAPTCPADTSIGVHARAQKCPKSLDKDVLVLLVPNNPKRVNTACHGDYEIGAKVIGQKGCTVAVYKAAMEKAGRKSLIPAEISWQLRAGFWGLKRAK